MVTNNGMFMPENEIEVTVMIIIAFYNAGVFGLSINILG